MAQPNAQNTSLFQPSFNALDGKNLQLRNPWRRFFAKTIDQIVVMILVFPVCFVLAVTIFLMRELIGANHLELIYNVLLYASFVTFSILYDGILLATWGTTPGKKLTGLKVSDSQGQKLDWGKSFFRAVWSNGLICIFALIPFASFIFLIVQKNRLHRTGFTTWDEQDGTLVYRV